MRIGVDAACWSNRRGFGRFTRSLVPEMVRRHPDQEFVLFVDAPSIGVADVPDGADVIAVEVSKAPSQAASADGRRSVADLARMTLAARKAHCDVVFFPATYTYFPVPGTPTVVTVHDAIAERLPHLVLPSTGARLAWRLKQRMALRGAQAVITVSEASRRALIDSLHVPPEMIHVIREAPDARFRPLADDPVWVSVERFGIARQGRYLLYVGGISPHKNLGVLVEAFEEVATRHRDVSLLLVGDTDKDPFLSSARELRERIDASPASGRIRLTGYVSDDDLVALYNGAVATVLPSLGEGFGLTAAESAACGTPVVASRDPALMELLEDDGIYADADDPRGFADAFESLLAGGDASGERSRRVRARAAAWSWGPAADKVVEILHAVGRSDG